MKKYPKFDTSKTANTLLVDGQGHKICPGVLLICTYIQSLTDPPKIVFSYCISKEISKVKKRLKC